MKAEDTVMSRERIDGTVGYFLGSPKILDGIVEVAEQQARISFKAGIKEVVESVNLMLYLPHISLENVKSLWKAKQREWGIE